MTLLGEHMVNAETKTDRRWVRTRKSIRNAFAKLLIDKELEKITVKEIVEIADINRNTFYLHYSNVNEVVEEIENEIIAAFTAEIERIEFSKLSKDPYLFYKSLNNLLYMDLDLNTAILRSIKSSTLSLRLKQILRDKLFGGLSLSNDIDPIALNVTVDFITAGMISVYQSWFLSDKSYSLDEASKVVSRLLAACVADVIDREVED